MGMQADRYMVAGYPFEGNANDIMGVNNGTVNGATFVDGKIGKAASFDGVDDSIEYGDVFDLGLGNKTISFWLNIRNHKGLQTYGIIGKTKYAGEFGRWFIYGEYTNIDFSIQFVTGVNSTISILKSSILVNTWYHVAWVINRSAFAKLYINCVEAGSVDISAYIAMNLETSLPFRIGAYSQAVAPHNPIYYMDGLIDSLKIRNKALTQSEIQRDYLNLPIF